MGEAKVNWMQTADVRTGVAPDPSPAQGPHGAIRKQLAGPAVVAHRHPLVAEVLVAALELGGVAARTDDGRPLVEAEVLVRDAGLGGSDVAHLPLDGAGPLTSQHDVSALIVLLQAPARGAELAPPNVTPVALPQLTDRERQVLALLSTGASNQVIGGQLGISPHTVRTHVQNLLGKLDVDSRLAAAAQARRHGLTGAAT